MTGVTNPSRLYRALAGLLAVALMAVAVPATLNAQTTLQAPRLVVRAVTTGDLALYKLPSTTQVSGGLNTVALGEPLYLEVEVDATIPANNIAGVIWTIVTKPAGSNAALVASPLGSNVPVYEPSDRLVYQVAGRQLLRPDVHGVYVISATVTAGSSGTTTVAQTFIAGTYVGISTCKECHNTGPAIQMVGPWSNTLHASIFTNGINGGSGTTGTSCLACHTVGYDANSTVNDGGFSLCGQAVGLDVPDHPAARQLERGPRHFAESGQHPVRELPWSGQRTRGQWRRPIAISVPSNTGACNQCHDEPTHHIKGTAWENSMHAVTTTDPAGNATCVGCHTGTGFIQRMAGISPITDTSYHSIDCATCHEPHGITAPANGSGDTHQIRNMASVTLADGTKVSLTGNDSQGYSSAAGEGILCMQCHQARVTAPPTCTPPPAAPTSARTKGRRPTC